MRATGCVLGGARRPIRVPWIPVGSVVIDEGMVLALFTVGDVYASLCKKGAYAPPSAQRRSRALFRL